MTDQQDQKTDATPVNPPAGAQNTDPTEQHIPKARFDEVNSARRVAEKRLAELEAKEAERNEAESLAKGEYTKLIDDLKPKAELAKALEATVKEYFELELADVPEDRRDLIPDGDVATKLKWLKKAKLAGVFGTPKAPNLDAGVTGDKGKPSLKLTDEERQLAQMAGMTPEQYATYKAGGKVTATVPDK